MVWLWDASKPGMFRGVSGSEARARQAAETLMREGRASAARVETAYLVTGFASLTSHYERTGRAWEARQGAGRITWVPLRAAS